MEKKEKNNRAYELLVEVTTIPKNLVSVHGIENATEFLLHNLSRKNCFNFSKAAYFIDNPDFDILKGVAGFAQQECYPQENHWLDQKGFSDHMNRSLFNKKVRDLSQNSIKKNEKKEELIIKELSEELAFEHPQYLLWPVKHENHGLLLFDVIEENDSEIQEHLQNALHLFGFCPVF